MVKRRGDIKRPSTVKKTDGQDEWLTRLSNCSPAIDAWQERTKNPVFSEPGSSLHADELPDLLNPETTAWYSMCVAVEHLAFTLDAMRATATMYPTAYMPAVRTAFMCAVNALYVLAGETRAKRRARVLRMRADELRVQIVGLGDMELPEGGASTARDDLIESVRARQTSLQQAAVALGSAEDVQKMKFNQTEAVNWVARYMYSHSDDSMLISAFQSVWRDGSSAVHGQLQYAIMRLHQNETVAREGNGSVVYMRGNLERDVGPAFVGAFLILNECFRLYDLRRVK